MGNEIPGLIKPGALLHKEQVGIKGFHIQENKTIAPVDIFADDAATTEIAQALKQDHNIMLVQLHRLNEGFAVIGAADDALHQIDKILNKDLLY